MMILAIDTSNFSLGVAICSKEKVLGECTTNLKKNHSVRLMPMIDQLLKEVEVDPAELSAIAVARGPGSYTGVRIGVATAKSMAWSLNIPLIGISSLEVLAWNGAYFPGMIVPLFDARRGQVYTGVYRSVPEGGVQLAEPERIVLFRQALEEWKTIVTEEPVLFLGDDVALHKETIQEILGTRAVFAPLSYQIPRAAHLGAAGWKALREGRVENTQTFAPVYLQLAEAEAKWLASQKK
ncbi:tRNA (adenosine(37)-N6)-threonylcarbamoyltransferase complex dimerization subunit type 1 TsaB [Aneurinibacillus thermoaerophilus]|uniref:tRNA (adenosine(37)-N6)-threonylcarbamoyltransferase complex dimerization subunit type 1 TsaB n=1 Tax=Aneurinibacillus thermoaerophilus TaxID=143495 RepID=UPI002E1D4BE1|nr:tRNA (adenosine(37)-N6)-threonylcarbamoyltransferase complex dimerization subunit type 1 TsaB [Aneurinibacillus thermoaerophilus]MED0738617.1 tRNA (adenosine(37)-N6)-threonylcarbamoyltransferase complex dimerization subunit type 1 TsaB [Aneurinibacillus thermoaerophilus]